MNHVAKRMQGMITKEYGLSEFGVLWFEGWPEDWRFQGQDSSPRTQLEDLPRAPHPKAL